MWAEETDANANVDKSNTVCQYLKAAALIKHVLTANLQKDRAAACTANTTVPDGSSRPDPGSV